MKTETVEQFLKRGGRINYIPKVEVAPGIEETKLKTKLLAMNWPTKLVAGAKVRKR